ncbi:multiple epidermal growth factor-like domains protein 8, partial [Terrapene carolina triunguis]|uniref:multiple epidermal growth factor-like domains protein 8 n=1 Tax=Terrapene triunguis TaxID=2587831 RepID=UPI0011567E18
PSSRHRVLLTFLFMDTECTYDYLFVYDGDSPRCPLLASLSGSTLPPPLEATSGKVTPHPGLAGCCCTCSVTPTTTCWASTPATGSRSAPAAAPATVPASPTASASVSLAGGGPDCAVPHCDSYCLGHGACDQESDRCRCQPGFVGEACDLALGENQGAGRWYNVSSGDPHFRPRTAAAGAVLPPTGAFYIFGGLDLNTALGDLVIYNFTSNLWQRRVLSPSP